MTEHGMVYNARLLVLMDVQDGITPDPDEVATASIRLDVDKEPWTIPVIKRSEKDLEWLGITLAVVSALVVLFMCYLVVTG